MTPTSITKPTRDTTLTSMPASSRARKPPVKARGMVNMTINGERRDWNWATITRYTRTMPSSSISSSCSMASIMASFSPWKEAVMPWGRSTSAIAVWAAVVTLVTL